MALAGPRVLVASGWIKVALGLLFSSLLGFTVASGLMLLVYWVFSAAVPTKVRVELRWLQILSSAFMAFGHGSNDGQKFIGAFSLALLLGGATTTFAMEERDLDWLASPRIKVSLLLPLWVILPGRHAGPLRRLHRAVCRLSKTPP